MDGQSPTTNDSENTNIPGPYLTPEQTETFPLKKVAPRESCGGSLRVIVTCFFVLTLAITIALAAQIHLGDYQLVPHGSVATDSHECSVIGTDILKQGGNSVDAAVASTLCMGVINPHVTGIGGGGFICIYNHRKRKVLDVIDFREVSPAVSVPGAVGLGLNVGVPGLVRGLALAHQLHGLLPWVDVVMPSVRIARAGFRVPESLVAAGSKVVPSDGSANEKLQEFMKPLEPGKILTSARLAGTLELIASVGPDVLYNGSLAPQILSAVSDAGGFMTQRDLAEYSPVRRGAMISTFAGFQVIVPGAPSGGPLLRSTLDHLNVSQENTTPVQMAVALEQVLASQAGQWGDPDYNSTASGPPTNSSDWNMPEAVGSHVAAIDSNDLYVSVVSGLNTWFGSQLLTDGGFLLNNALANFGTGSNAPGPSKRPLSLATPVMAVEDGIICGRRLVLGAGDFSVAAQILVQLVSKGNNITSGVEAPRFRFSNQKATLGLEPWHEPKLSESAVNQLASLGFKLLPLPDPYQSCNVVEKVGDDLSSHSDSRGKGIASRF